MSEDEFFAEIRKIADVAYSAFCGEEDEAEALSWINNHCRDLLKLAKLPKGYHREWCLMIRGECLLYNSACNPDRTFSFITEVDPA